MRHERDITAAAETFLDGRCSILVGDVRARLRELPDDHFDCVVTSPPYWGLRDYGVEGQLGMEPSVGAHLDAMMEVFEEVRRVLKPSGTCWVNYGDCYATTPNGRSAAETKASGGDDRTFRDKPFSTVGPVGGLGLGKGGGGRHGASKNLRNGGDDGEGYPALRVEAAGYLKPKDLVMMPNRFAIAMQDAGWWVRSEIVWGKPNGMPDSSGRFRPATAHEKIFLFTKSDAPEFWVARDTGEISQDPDFSEQVVMVSTITDKCPEGRLGPRWIALGHYYDAEAVRLPATPASIQRWSQDIASQDGSDRAVGKTNGPMKAVGGGRDAGRLLRNYEPAGPVPVWELATAAFRDAHFATFPPSLVERCLRGGCPKGGHVLDPFGGAGTTGMVAAIHGYEATLIEINPDYAAMARRRIESCFTNGPATRRAASAKARHGDKPGDAGPLFREERP